MPDVVVASSIARWLNPSADTMVGELRARVDLNEASNIGDALAELFERYPALKSYIVDERNRIRHHVVVFVNGEAVPGKDLSHRIEESDSIYLFQALSGG
jgi:sulfur-carrier protein